MITGDCVGGGGRRGRENGEANKRKNGVSCSTGISLLVFFFFFLIATDIDIVFFPPPFPSLLPLALFCSRIYYPYSYYFASVRLI